MDKVFDRLTVCLDMVGCPNRCKHCWIGVHSNGNLNLDDLIYVSEEFKKVSKKIELYGWYREPDYHKDYKGLYNLERKLSDYHKEHFELISYYRAVRDNEYIPWLRTIGLKIAQLTFFGLEEKTDYYVGRRGAFKELLKTIELLLDNNIAPRIQIFIYKDNINELDDLMKLFFDLKLEERCKAIGQEFVLFAHQGSPTGESLKLIDNWLVEEDLGIIPQYLAEKTFIHFKASSYKEIFGVSEKQLYEKYLIEMPDLNFIVENPVFFIDANFNVYPNHSETNKYWLLGNLKEIGIKRIIDNYLNEQSIAQNVFLNISFKDILLEIGDPYGNRLFCENDYVFYILERYLKIHY